MTSWPKWNNQTRPAVHIPLGRIGYDESLTVQMAVHRRCLENDWADTLLTLEHDPVITLGRSSSADHILASQQELDGLGIVTRPADRGGSVTYHGPGQLVLYAIADLRRHGKDIRRFVTALEQAMLAVLAPLGINAARNPQRPGLWVGNRKIASIGVAVRHWITRHGLALNVAVNPEHFRTIHPCGLKIETVSIGDFVDKAPSMEALASQLVERMAVELAWTVSHRTPAQLKEALE